MKSLDGTNEDLSDSSSQAEVKLSLKSEDLEIWKKEGSPVKKKLYHLLNRHLILQLYIKLTKDLINEKEYKEVIVKNAYKMLKFVSEQSVDAKASPIIEDDFLCCNFAKILQPQSEFS